MSPTEPELRVLTLNLLSPADAAYPRRRPVLAAGIAALDADLIALQETGPDRLVPDGYHVVHHPDADPVGALLATRWPPGAVHTRDLHLTPRVDLPWAAAVAAFVDTPLGTVLFVHHKPSWQVGHARERELQAVATARFAAALTARHDVPVILAGDFDDTPDSASIRFLTGRQSLDGYSVAYRDAWAQIHPDDPGHTFTPGNPLVAAGQMAQEPGRRIDYVMLGCGPHGPALRVTGCRRVLDEPVDGVWASDHFGVLARFGPPEHPPGTWRA